MAESPVEWTSPSGRPWDMSPDPYDWARPGWYDEDDDELDSPPGYKGTRRLATVESAARAAMALFPAHGDEEYFPSSDEEDEQ